MTTLFLRPVVYDRPTTIHTPGGAFRELVAPGALRHAIERPSRTVALRDHAPGRLLGRASAGTLKLRDTPTALEAIVDLPPTELGHETATLVGRGDLRGASFSFTTAEESWIDPEDDGPPVRVIRQVGELFDISPCTWPAYESTEVWLGGQPLSPRASTPSARSRRLDFLEKQIQRERVLQARAIEFGRQIPRPEWAPRPFLASRHGCGHVSEASD